MPLMNLFVVFIGGGLGATWLGIGLGRYV